MYSRNLRRTSLQALVCAIILQLMADPVAANNVIAWGGGFVGETNACAFGLVAISAGSCHTLLLKRDGTVVTCGKYLFHPSFPSEMTPEQPAGISNVVAIASGAAHALALRSDGTVLAWGDNSYGQTNVPSGLDGVIAISAAHSHNLALRHDGRVVQWGSPGSLSESQAAELTNVIAIAAGTGSAALKGDGKIVAWNVGDTAEASLEAITDVVGISGGWNDWLVLKADGSVVGHDGAILPYLNDIEDIIASPGSDHHIDLAMTRQGTVVGWGFNFYEAGGIPIPTVPPGLSRVVAVAAGDGHNAVLLGDGPPFVTAQPVSRTVVMSGTTCFRVKATGAFPLTYQWKRNGVPIPGQTTSRCLLTNLQPADAGAYTVDVRSGNVAVTSVGATLSLIPLQIDEQPKSQSQFVTGTAAFEVVVQGIEPLSYQWRHNGTNLAGAKERVLTLSNLGYEHGGDYSVLVANAHGEILSQEAQLTVYPVLITGQPKDQVSFRGGSAGFTVGAVGAMPLSYQWLHNGQQLPGVTNSSLELASLRQEQTGSYTVLVSNPIGQVESAPAQLHLPSVVAWGDITQSFVPGFLTNAIGIASANDHNLAITDDRQVAAWGGRFSDVGTNVPPGAREAVALARIGYSGGSVVIKSDGSVLGWGANLPPLTGISNLVAAAVAYDFLGLRSDGTIVASGYGTQHAPTDLSNIVSVAIGYAHGVALRSDGRVIAWGVNDKGQAAVPTDLTNAIGIAAHYNNSMALRSDGTVVVWGDNWQGQTNVPPELTNVVRIAAGEFHCMALRADGTVVVWGDNWKGQTNVPSGLTNVVAIAAGGRNCLALLGDGPPVLRRALSDARMQDGQFVVQIPTESGRVYRLEHQTDLSEDEWRCLGLEIGTGEPILAVDPTGLGEARFYRVRDW